MIFLIMFITLKEPASFYNAYQKPLIVKECDNDSIFHATNHLGKFNLPEGIYDINANCEPLPIFSPYNKIPQFSEKPFKEGSHNIKFYSGTSMMGDRLGFSPGNKASFFPELNIAVFDDKYILHPYMPARRFIAAHEEGHTYYRQQPQTLKIMDDPNSSEEDFNNVLADYLSTEHNCDIYAHNKLIRNGYNPEQVKLAAKCLLNGDNPRFSMLLKKIALANEN